MAVCKVKHTKFQPTQKQWRCPKCGADSESLYISDGPEGVEETCEKVHEEDWVRCVACHSGWSGRDATSEMAKKIRDAKAKGKLMPCPHCGGTGYVGAKAPKKGKD